MLVVISPAKTLDFKTPPPTQEWSEPLFMSEAGVVMKKLKTLKPARICNLMNISPSLGQVNFDRYQAWTPDFTLENSKQAIFAFNGDVYQGLKSYTLNEDEIRFAQNHVRILSGLFGVLRPLDLIKPYRLEMGIELKVNRKKNLYEFWGNKITEVLSKELAGSNSGVLVNLASNEYFKSIRLKKIGFAVITPEFRDWSGDGYKMVSFYAKHARGLMTRFIIENRISEPEDLKAFNSEGYIFNPRFSEGNTFVFTREK